MNDMRQKLIELVSKVQYLGGLEEKVADHLISNGVIVSEWTPVSELPKEDGQYLVVQKRSYGSWFRILRFAKNGREVDDYYFRDEWKNVWFYYDSEWGYITVNDVTHWMPLPEEPKGE